MRKMYNMIIKNTSKLLQEQRRHTQTYRHTQTHTRTHTQTYRHTHRHTYKLLSGCEEVEHCTSQLSWTSQLPTTSRNYSYRNFTSQPHKY